MFLYGKKIPRKTISAPISDGKGCDKWHMLAFSWSPGQLRVNADNRPGKTFNIAFDMTDADEMSEIEALLGASDMNEISEESSALLRMLEEAEAQAPIQLDENEILEVDEAELDAILSMGSSGQVSDVKLEEDSADNKKKSKKENGIKSRLLIPER